MTRTKYPQHLFTLEQKRERIRVKRDILMLVRAFSDEMNTVDLYKILGKNLTLIHEVVWRMQDCGELVLSENRKWILGPRAPKLRKKGL